MELLIFLVKVTYCVAAGAVAVFGPLRFFGPRLDDGINMPGSGGLREQGLVLLMVASMITIGAVLVAPLLVV